MLLAKNRRGASQHEMHPVGQDLFPQFGKRLDATQYEIDVELTDDEYVEAFHCSRAA